MLTSDPPPASAAAAATARIEAQARRAAHRARDTGTPALLRLHLSLGPQDPWAGLATLPPQTPFFAWNDAAAPLCIGAWGSLCELRLPRAERFAAARAHCSQLLEQVIDVRVAGLALDVDAPLCCAAFAFAAGAAQPDPMWAGWGGGCLYVPPTLLYRRHPEGDCVAVLAERVDAAADPQLVAAALQARAAALRRQLRGPVAAAPSAPAGLAPAAQEAAASWEARVALARGAARAGALDKVVLARAADFTPPAGHTFDAWQTLAALRAQQPDGLSFAVGLPHGTFLGAPPELLARVSGRTLFTQAVAGTAPRGADAAADAALGAALEHSAKDCREHAVVADGLATVLRPWCTELRHPPAPRLVRLPRLQHLETPFEGTLRQAGGILQLIEQLHPTASVGGWPAAAACAWLRAHEALDRGLYAGPVGWLTAAGDGAFGVAIRSVLLRGARARAYAGAGVVAASEPAAEWQETALKMRTVGDALRLRPAA